MFESTVCVVWTNILWGRNVFYLNGIWDTTEMLSWYFGWNLLSFNSADKYTKNIKKFDPTPLMISGLVICAFNYCSSFQTHRKHIEAIYSTLFQRTNCNCPNKLNSFPWLAFKILFLPSYRLKTHTIYIHTKHIMNSFPMISAYADLNHLKKLKFFHRVLINSDEILDPLQTTENSHQFQLLFFFFVSYFIAAKWLKCVESCRLKPVNVIFHYGCTYCRQQPINHLSGELSLGNKVTAFFLESETPSKVNLENHMFSTVLPDKEIMGIVIQGWKGFRHSHFLADLLLQVHWSWADSSGISITYYCSRCCIRRVTFHFRSAEIPFISLLYLQ